MRKLYWYLSTYIRKHGLAFIISIILAVVFFSFLVPSISRMMTFKKRHYIAIVGQYSLSNLPDPIKNQLSAGLTGVAADLQPEPLLAERWSIEDEEKQYRFILKKGILWQDGTELVPEDVKYNFSDVEIIHTPNDVIFTLPEAFAPFAISVSEPIFKTSWEKKAFGRQQMNIVGIGQYKMVDYKLQGNYLKEFRIDGPKDRYIYRFYLTEAEAAQAFKKGEVDILLDMASCYGLCDWNGLEVVKDLAYDRYLAVFFNNANPKLGKNVRQALSYALEKETGEVRAIGPINPQSWAYLEGGKDYAKDWDRAVERLIDEMPREPLHFEMVTTSNFVDDAEDIKQQWSEFSDFAKEQCQSSKDVKDKNLCENLDIDLSIKITNFPDTANYELLLLGQEIPIDPDQYVMWHSSQATNFTNYKNTRIDSLLEKGRQIVDLAERKTIYQEFQQYLLEDPPAIFLKHLENISIAR